jgi:hypothetical protein
MDVKRVGLVLAACVLLLATSSVPARAAPDSTGVGTTTWRFGSVEFPCPFASNRTCNQASITFVGFLERPGGAGQVRVELPAVAYAPAVTSTAPPCCAELSDPEPVQGRTKAGVPIRGACRDLRADLVKDPVNDNVVVVIANATCSIRIGVGSAFAFTPRSVVQRNTQFEYKGYWVER